MALPYILCVFGAQRELGTASLLTCARFCAECCAKESLRQSGPDMALPQGVWKSSYGTCKAWSPRARLDSRDRGGRLASTPSQAYIGEVILPTRDLPHHLAEGNLDGDQYWIVGSSQ